MRILKVIFLSSIIFLSFCKNKNENIDPETKKKIELINKIKQRTERDLNKLGIKKILLNNNGRWDLGSVMIIEFKEDGRAYKIINGDKTGFFYWKIENNKLYINPNKVIFPFNENKFFEIKLIPIVIPIHIEEVSILERCKYSIKIESEDKRISLIRLISILPQKVVD